MKNSLENLYSKLQEKGYKEDYEKTVQEGRKEPLGKSGEKGKSELHHILPKSLGGTDEIENLTKLSVWNHLKVHFYLAQCGYPEMTYALVRMLSGNQWTYLTEEEQNRFKKEFPEIQNYLQDSFMFVTRSDFSRSEKVSSGRTQKALQKKAVYNSEDFQEWFQGQKKSGFFHGDAMWEKAINTYLKEIGKTLDDYEPAKKEVKQRTGLSSNSVKKRMRYVYKKDLLFQEWISKRPEFKRTKGWTGSVRIFLQEQNQTILDYPEYCDEKPAKKQKQSTETIRKRIASTEKRYGKTRTILLSKDFQNWLSEQPDEEKRRVCKANTFSKVSKYLLDRNIDFNTVKETEKVKQTPISKNLERILKGKICMLPEYLSWYKFKETYGLVPKSPYRGVNTFLQDKNYDLLIYAELNGLM